MRTIILTSLAMGAMAASVGTTLAQSAPPPAYGETINSETAKKAAAAAVAEATKNNWGMCVAVVAPSGDLVYFERMDNCQYASITISQHKAKAAAIFRRPTKVFEDVLVAGGAGIRMLAFSPDLLPVEGGVPLIEGGLVVGAIGVSGMQSYQDGQVAAAGARVLGG